MTGINWGLAQGPNAFERSLAMGMQLGEAFNQRRARNALADYASNPQGDPGDAIRRGADPRSVYGIQRGAQEQQQAEAQAQAARQKAMMDQLPVQIQMLEAVKANPALAPQIHAQAMQMGVQVPPLEQITPEWIDEQLAVS